MITVHFKLINTIRYERTSLILQALVAIAADTNSCDDLTHRCAFQKILLYYMGSPASVTAASAAPLLYRSLDRLRKWQFTRHILLIQTLFYLDEK